MECTLEIYFDNKWHQAAIFKVEDQELSRGYRGRSELYYTDDFALTYSGERGNKALSCNLPVILLPEILSSWPPFILDLLPSGAARSYWTAELGLVDGPGADWKLLLRGAGNPPGNIRVAEAAPPPDTQGHPGFARSEIVDRKENFIEYARSHGAPIVGSSGAQGDAPKFLLTTDRSGNWHADGVLPDKDAQQHWLVKFPRGRTQRDRQVIQNEAAYMRVAKGFGIRVEQLPEYESDCLFVPRFDRVAKQSTVRRLGLESIISLAGIADFGVFIKHEIFCRAITKHCTAPVTELREYLFRDVLNYTLGNVDNHGRNTALLKKEDGTVALSPLYDFAPMFLDPSGMVRVSRWQDEASDSPPPWHQAVANFNLDDGLTFELARELRGLAPKVRKLPELMKKAGVDQEIIAARKPYIETSAKVLEK